MPNPQEDTQNYEHIRALVRDLHITRNIARPEHLVETSTSCKNVSIAQKLIVHQLNALNGPCKATVDHSNFFIEDDDASTNTSSLDLSLTLPNNKRTKGTSIDTNFSIPSVVITDVNEPLDLITSTQRRFSQLYSGLRRFSTSHTVGYEY